MNREPGCAVYAAVYVCRVPPCSEEYVHTKEATQGTKATPSAGTAKCAGSSSGTFTGSRVRL
jgi:hypothetical protein